MGQHDVDRLSVGEHWAYRASVKDPLDEVEVLRFGTKRPARVLVRFIAAEQEAREEWVAPSRLKVLWPDREAFIDRELRWAAVRGVAYLRDAPLDWAIMTVFDALPDWHFAEPGYNDDTGVLKIRDLDGLLAALDLERSAVAGHPLAFIEDGVLMAPWPVTELVVRRMAERHSDALLASVDAEEQKARSHNRWGYYSSGDNYISPEICSVRWTSNTNKAATSCGTGAVSRVAIASTSCWPYGRRSYDSVCSSSRQ